MYIVCVLHLYEKEEERQVMALNYSMGFWFENMQLSACSHVYTSGRFGEGKYFQREDTRLWKSLMSNVFWI